MPSKKIKGVQLDIARQKETIDFIKDCGYNTLHFLQFPEMRYISDLKEGIKGRFSYFPITVCPSLKETYDKIKSF
jgi:hypothetical protein